MVAEQLHAWLAKTALEAVQERSALLSVPASAMTGKHV
jgi:hypothetical protein